MTHAPTTPAADAPDTDASEQTTITRIDDLDLALAFKLHALDEAEAHASGRGLALTTAQGLLQQLSEATAWIAGPREAPIGWASLEGGLVSGTVHPEHRRTGLGTALLDALLATVGESAPRMRLTAAVWRDSAGEEFLHHRGFGPTSTAPYAVRRLDLGRTAERRARVGEDAEPFAAGYQFVRVAGEEQVGRTDFVVHARQKDTGAEAGRALLTVADDVPSAAIQGELHVAEEHRGHRLGLLMELELLKWLTSARPAALSLQLSHGLDDSQAIVIADRLGSRVAGVMVELSLG